jgi:hypothetical protein
MSGVTTRDVYFDKILQRWIQNTAYRLRWRIAGWYDVIDLIQDGYVCYCKCRDKYALQDPDPGENALNTDNPTKEQRRQFMSLVQRAFINRIHTLSNEFPAFTEEPVDCSIIDDSNIVLENMIPPQPEEASILMALASAPAEIGAAIGGLVRDGLDGEAYVRTRLRKRLILTKHASGGVSVATRVVKERRAFRETTSEHLKRVLGDGDITRKVTDYLYS